MVEEQSDNGKTINQGMLDRLRDLIEEAPRCDCGGNCKLLQHLAAQVLDIQLHEVGFKLNCSHCQSPLIFHHTNSLYQCRECTKWFRTEPHGALIEILAKPRADF